MQATAKLKVFFSSYLCQEIEGRWKHPDWRENPKSMLTPSADLQAEIALRADFWNVCCKPLLRLKEREFGYKQHLSEQAANLSSTVAAFLSFIADALNREGGDDGPVKYRNPFSVFNRGGTPIALGDGSKVAKTRKSADKTFAWMEHRCPQLLDWRAFAIEYVAQLRVAVPSALSGLGLFFEVYLSGAGQASACLEGVSPAMVRSPTEYLARSNRLPDTFKVVSRPTEPTP